MIAVLKTISFFIQYEMFVIYDFLCLLCRFSTLAGPVNEKSSNLKQCTVYANVLVTTINSMNLTNTAKSSVL